MSSPAPFPRQLAVPILAAIACSFAGNHIAARIAFDHDTGLLLAMLCRAGLTVLALIGLLIWRRQPLRLAPRTWGWQLLLGLLIALQSFCIYSAVARIPVALALLVVNLAPILLALLTWALGGPMPTRRVALLMGLILFGLMLALDVPGQLGAANEIDTRWMDGVLFGVSGAAVFACALWITDHRLAAVPGTLRSMLTLLVVAIASALAGFGGLLPGGMNPPNAGAGWIALGCLVLLYGVAFSALFICMTRLDIARNAPVMNVEPVAGLLFGWLILGQALGAVQLVGSSIVVGGILLLTYRRRS